MKNILKNYYKLDEESKEMLPFFYMYQELLSAIDNYENVKIDNMYDEEILMQTIIKSWHSTDLDATNIVNKLLTILNCQDITIRDFENLSTDELQELLYDEKSQEQSEILAEFTYKIFDCVLCKNRGQYLLALNSDETTDVLVFNEIKDIFSPVIKQHLLDKFLYGKPNNYEYSNL